jgi:hypothetical protein
MDVATRPPSGACVHHEVDGARRWTISPERAEQVFSGADRLGYLILDQAESERTRRAAREAWRARCARFDRPTVIVVLDAGGLAVMDWSWQTARTLPDVDERILGGTAHAEVQAALDGLPAPTKKHLFGACPTFATRMLARSGFVRTDLRYFDEPLRAALRLVAGMLGARRAQGLRERIVRTPAKGAAPSQRSPHFTRYALSSKDVFHLTVSAYRQMGLPAWVVVEAAGGLLRIRAGAAGEGYDVRGTPERGAYFARYPLLNDLGEAVLMAPTWTIRWPLTLGADGAYTCLLPDYELVRESRDDAPPTPPVAASATMPPREAAPEPTPSRQLTLLAPVLPAVVRPSPEQAPPAVRRPTRDYWAVASGACVTFSHALNDLEVVYLNPDRIATVLPVFEECAGRLAEVVRKFTAVLAAHEREEEETPG